MTVLEFYNELTKLYPTSLSSSWDNDGLMCCPSGDATVKRVLVSLDATLDCLEYAAKEGFDLVLCHHPLIFKGLKALNELDVVGNRVICAMKAGVSVISLHTRLDAGEGGVNDTLAELLSLSDITVFGDDDNPSLGRIGTLPEMTPADFALFAKERLFAPAVCAYAKRNVNRVAVVGGGGGDLALWAKAMGADTLLTGECGYNKAIDSAEWGINIFTAGHYYTEMPVCQKLCGLAKSIAGAEAEIFEPAPEMTF